MVDRVRNRLAQNKKPPLEHGLVLDMRAALDKNLAAYRFSRPDARAKTRRIDRRVAPTESDLSLRGNHFVNNVFDDPAALPIARQEQRADGIFARRRQDETELGCLLGEKAMRDLNQHAAAIARLGVGADRAAMIEIAQNLEAHGDNFVRPASAQVRDETEPPGGLHPPRRANKGLARPSARVLAVPGRERSDPSFFLPPSIVLPQRGLRAPSKRA